MKKTYNINQLFTWMIVSLLICSVVVFVPQTTADNTVPLIPVSGDEPRSEGSGWIRFNVYGESEGKQYDIYLITAWINGLPQKLDLQSMIYPDYWSIEEIRNSHGDIPLPHISLLAGTYNISVTEPGHEPSETQTVQVKSNEIVNLTFTLKKLHTTGAINGTVYGTLMDLMGFEYVPLYGENDGLRAVLRNDPGFDAVPLSERFPLSNTSISIISSYTGEKLATTQADQNGKYFIPVEVGIYFVAVKTGLHVIQGLAIVEENNISEVNFLFQVTEDFIKVNEAIRTGSIGGEIIVQKEENNAIANDVLIYDGVTITPTDIVQGKVSVIIGGEGNSSGKTIAFTIDDNVLDANGQLAITYDGETIKMADSIEDVLNPNDDGSHPEYFIIQTYGGFQILISVPHFSEHSITISSVIEMMGGIYAVILYISVFLILGVFYITSFFFVRGRKRK